MEKTSWNVGDYMDKVISYIIPFATFMLGIMGYERLLKKDNETQTRNMTILMTKVDMLLTQSTSMSGDVKRHDEMLITHDVKIQNLENTLGFRRVKHE
jgi:hypothetical protein